MGWTRERRARGALGAAAIGLVVLTLQPQTVEAVPAGAAPTSHWHPYRAPSIGGEQMSLESVAAAGPSDVWAVGYMWTNLGGALEFRTVTDHWNGSAWTMIPSPDRETAPAVDTLYGVSAASSTDVWAVGDSAPNGQAASTLVLHWNGRAWSIVTTPNPIAYGDYLSAVSARPGEVWAVGSAGDPALNEVPLVLHEDASGWHVDSFAIPAICASGIVLTGVDASSSSSVRATGTCGLQRGGTAGFVAERSTHGWSVVATTVTTSAQDRLNAIAGAGADVWAVGDSQVIGGSSSRTANTLHRVGHSYSEFIPPDAGTQPGLNGVASRRVGRQAAVLAVGLTTSATDPTPVPLILRWDRGDWDRVAVTGAGILSSAAIEPAGRAWAVGWNGGQALILGDGP